MSEYFRHSSTTYYSLIASLPLLLGYEILVTLTQSPFWGVRNAADVWIRTFMMAFDIRPQYIFFVMILIVIGMIPVIKVKGSAPPLKGSIFLFMFLEALAYSMVLGIVLHFMVRLVLLSAGGFAGNALQNIALSLGAGLFEEFFFRVLLLNVLLKAKAKAKAKAFLFLNIGPVIKGVTAAEELGIMYKIVMQRDMLGVFI